jgi:predicted ArsR family transcriptional regulator
LRSGPKTVKDIADSFSIHPNVARAHLELMAEAGFLMTETRRRNKGRPAKVYFTWEGEANSQADGSLAIQPSGTPESIAIEELKIELRTLERQLNDATAQLARVKELVGEASRSQSQKEETNG